MWATTRFVEFSEQAGYWGQIWKATEGDAALEDFVVTAIWGPSYRNNGKWNVGQAWSWQEITTWHLCLTKRSVMLSWQLKMQPLVKGNIVRANHLDLVRWMPSLRWSHRQVTFYKSIVDQIPLTQKALALMLRLVTMIKSSSWHRVRWTLNDFKSARSWNCKIV